VIQKQTTASVSTRQLLFLALQPVTVTGHFCHFPLFVQILKLWPPTSKAHYRCLFLLVPCTSFRLSAILRRVSTFKPLNAELNPICHLLVLLGDLTFLGLCIVSIFQYISNKMQRYTVYLYLETALHVSGGTSTHHQERIQLYLQHLAFVTPLLLSAAIQLFHYSSR
jgi:hypothetical protein